MASEAKDSSASADLPATTKDPTSARSGGFRSFWKQDKTASVSSGKGSPSVDGSDGSVGTQKNKSGSRVGRFLKRGSSGKNGSTAEKQGEVAGGAAGDKRRQQIYQAQKRHRNRQADYIKNLEEEVAKLRNMDSSVRQEKSSLENQNRMMKELLASHSIDAQLGSLNLAVPSSTSDRDVNMSDFARVDVRYDADVGHERTFLDLSETEDMVWSSATDSTTPDVKMKGSVKGDSWAAVDFILALEWPCQGHMVHSNINPDVVPHIKCQLANITGHSLTATAAVYESALPPPAHLHKHTTNGASTQEGEAGTKEDRWLLPHSEIDKLVTLSENLPLDDDQMTPAQAYSAVKQTVASDDDLKPILELLKIPLSVLAECRGYGAVLPADQFWQHLDTAISSLQS